MTTSRVTVPVVMDRWSIEEGRAPFRIGDYVQWYLRWRSGAKADWLAPEFYGAVKALVTPAGAERFEVRRGQFVAAWERADTEEGEQIVVGFAIEEDYLGGAFAGLRSHSHITRIRIVRSKQQQLDGRLQPLLPARPYEDVQVCPTRFSMDFIYAQEGELIDFDHGLLIDLQVADDDLQLARIVDRRDCMTPPRRRPTTDAPHGLSAGRSFDT